MKTPIFKAKYPGVCVRCNNSFRIGDQIAGNLGNTGRMLYVHKHCLDRWERKKLVKGKGRSRK